RAGWPVRLRGRGSLLRRPVAADRLESHTSRGPALSHRDPRLASVPDRRQERCPHRGDRRPLLAVRGDRSGPLPHRMRPSGVDGTAREAGWRRPDGRGHGDRGGSGGSVRRRYRTVSTAGVPAFRFDGHYADAAPARVRVEAAHLVVETIEGVVLE